MKISNIKVIHFGCASCMVTVMALLSSCSSADHGYSQWGSKPPVYDTGPGAVTAVGADDPLPPEPEETVTPEPTPIEDLQPVAIVKPIEAMPVAAPRPVASKKKKSGFFALFGKKKSGQANAPTYAANPAPEPSPETVAAADPEPVVSLLPKPHVHKRHRRSPTPSEVMARNKKKSPRDFDSWLKGNRK